MTLDTLIMLAGVFVAALPFLGFPSRWDQVLLFIVGVLIVCFGVALRRRSSRGHSTYLNSPSRAETEHEAL